MISGVGRTEGSRGCAMNRRRFLIAILPTSTLIAACGCNLIARLAEPIRNEPPAQPPPVTYSQYHLEGFAWDSVARVLVLPPLNESEHVRTAHEVQSAFVGELQRLGRFEVIAAPFDDEARLTKVIHRSGTFNEKELLIIGKETRADVIIHTTITQYSPYHPRTRLGLVVQAVAPLEAKVVASVDGLWDTADSRLADRVRTFYRQAPRKRAWIRNHLIATDDTTMSEIALDSPALFQRFVLNDVSRMLLQLNGMNANGIIGEPCAR